TCGCPCPDLTKGGPRSSGNDRGPFRLGRARGTPVRAVGRIVGDARGHRHRRDLPRPCRYVAPDRPSRAVRAARRTLAPPLLRSRVFVPARTALRPPAVVGCLPACWPGSWRWVPPLPPSPAARGGPRACAGPRGPPSPPCRGAPSVGPPPGGCEGGVAGVLPP